MRVIGICGIWDNFLYDRVWQHFAEAFGKQFPGSSFATERLWFWPWQKNKMLDFANRIIAKYDDGEEIMLLGWSMGGVIATSIAPKFTKSYVRAVVTVFSPHRFLFGLFSKMLGSIPERLGKIPVVSFSAIPIDELVWYGARYPGAIKHVNILSDHGLALIFSPKPAATIAEAVRMTPELHR